MQRPQRYRLLKGFHQIIPVNIKCKFRPQHCLTKFIEHLQISSLQFLTFYLMNFLYNLCINMLWPYHLIIQPQYLLSQLSHIISQLSQLFFLNKIINNMFLQYLTPFLKRFNNLLFHIMNFSYRLKF